jgi:hypothetical protein
MIAAIYARTSALLRRRREGGRTGMRLVEWVALGLVLALFVAGILISAMGGWSVLMPGTGWFAPLLVWAAGLAVAFVAAWMFIGVAWLKLRSIRRAQGKAKR